ncbi:YbaY family lipoprotein [Rosenbergiella australiborealis]|uniref:YbaY family lipoprotein n=1 Tax=Rosenbergiella australiborealis TaxID=1544696 RepID=UPI001F4D7E87|nr:YbaY family lipoprotein [Rosenbergiella australiborealis]
MKAKHVLSGLLISVAVTSCASHPGVSVPVANDPTTQAVAPFSLNGSVFVRQRMAIPANAALTVTLSDASGGPGQTKILAQQVQTLAGKQSPFSYVLPLQGVQLGADSKAMLTAAITLNGKVIFTSDKLQPIATVVSQTKDINLVPVPQIALPISTQ